jgi:hypothetical protein
MSRRARLLTPILLAMVGIILLIGCFPIPATQQLQPDNRFRPDYFVGSDKSKPIQVGVTRIDDAFIELSRRTQLQMAADARQSSVMRNLSQWTVSPDGRKFARVYDLRTATWVAPLCFAFQEQTERRWIILEVGAQGVVTGSATLSQAPGWGWVRIERWLEVFDPPTRAKLAAAGVFPPDQVLLETARKQRNYDEQIRQKRQQRIQSHPQRQPATTSP